MTHSKDSTDWKEGPPTGTGPWRWRGAGGKRGIATWTEHGYRLNDDDGSAHLSGPRLDWPERVRWAPMSSDDTAADDSRCPAPPDFCTHTSPSGRGWVYKGGAIAGEWVRDVDGAAPDRGGASLDEWDAANPPTGRTTTAELPRGVWQAGEPSDCVVDGSGACVVRESLALAGHMYGVAFFADGGYWCFVWDDGKETDTEDTDEWPIGVEWRTATDCGRPMQPVPAAEPGPANPPPAESAWTLGEPGHIAGAAYPFRMPDGSEGVATRSHGQWVLSFAGTRSTSRGPWRDGWEHGPRIQPPSSPDDVIGALAEAPAEPEPRDVSDYAVNVTGRGPCTLLQMHAGKSLGTIYEPVGDYAYPHKAGDRWYQWGPGCFEDALEFAQMVDDPPVESPDSEWQTTEPPRIKCRWRHPGARTEGTATPAATDWDLRMDGCPLEKRLFVSLPDGWEWAPLDADTAPIEVVLATADESLTLEWGIEYATEGALSDPAHLAALKGLPALMLGSEGIRVVGSVVGARWDSASRQLLADLAVEGPEDRQHIREFGAVESYTAVVTEGGHQAGRVPRHVMVMGARQIRASDPKAPGATPAPERTLPEGWAPKEASPCRIYMRADGAKAVQIAAGEQSGRWYCVGRDGSQTLSKPTPAEAIEELDSMPTTHHAELAEKAGLYQADPPTPAGDPPPGFFGEPDWQQGEPEDRDGAYVVQFRQWTGVMFWSTKRAAWRVHWDDGDDEADTWKGTDWDAGLKWKSATDCARPTSTPGPPKGDPPARVATQTTSAAMDTATRANARLAASLRESRKANDMLAGLANARRIRVLDWRKRIAAMDVAGWGWPDHADTAAGDAALWAMLTGYIGRILADNRALIRERNDCVSDVLEWRGLARDITGNLGLATPDTELRTEVRGAIDTIRRDLQGRIDKLLTEQAGGPGPGCAERVDRPDILRHFMWSNLEPSQQVVSKPFCVLAHIAAQGGDCDLGMDGLVHHYKNIDTPEAAATRNKLARAGLLLNRKGPADLLVGLRVLLEARDCALRASAEKAAAF